MRASVPEKLFIYCVIHNMNEVNTDFRLKYQKDNEPIETIVYTNI